MASLTPQQKKRFSLAKDCRNTYGENDKASRKNIPRSRARRHRQYRREIKQALHTHADLASMDPEAVQTAALEVRRSNWRKAGDVPLGTYLQWREEDA